MSGRLDSSTTTRPFLGFESNAKKPSVGFRMPDPLPNSSCPEAALHDGKSHLLTIGATGSGKTNLLIANLLQYAGSTIVIDIRGDAVRATERYRREVLGQATFVLDPFGVSGKKCDRLNPLDLALLPDIEIESECQSLASTLAAKYLNAREPYWGATASDLIAADLAFLLSQKDPAERSFDRLVELVFNEDSVYRHAVLLDNQVEKDSFAYNGIAAFINLPENSSNTRYCVLSTVQSILHSFRSKAIRSALAGPSTIDVLRLLDGEPSTIYLVLPIERMSSHGVCLRTWLDLLLQVLMRRQVPPEIPTLVMVDEAAQIGPCPALKTVATYLRAHGVRLWTFWQDLSQLRSIYPDDWETLVNNTSALSFMPGTGLASQGLAAMAGVSRGAIESLASDQQLVCETGQSPRIVRMARYWVDALFKDRYDSIPRFATGKGRKPLCR